MQQCCVIVFRRGRRIKNKYISSKPHYIYNNIIVAHDASIVKPCQGYIHRLLWVCAVYLHTCI